MIRKIISWVILLTFNVSLVSPLQAQVLAPAGTHVASVSVFNPALIKGLTIHPDNPLMFDFIIHPGDERLQADQFKKESQKLIKYFLASLTVPEKEMWVNLSPTEKDRIIPDEFGQTEMGRDLLMQDYFLKKLTASLISPDHKAGKELWEKIYSQTQEKFGTTNIPMDILSKVWIVPESAKIYENGKSVFVVDAHLKVLMESDYLDTKIENGKEKIENNPSSIVYLLSSILKEIIIPAIEHEVNNGPAFANLRQIYNAVILATWYKKNLKQSLLGQVYVDRGKTEGVSHHDPKAKESIYNQYLEAFKKGADAIQEEYDPATQEVITRKYISGGMDLAQLGEKVKGVTELPRSLEGSNAVRVELGSVGKTENGVRLVSETKVSPDAAMSAQTGFTSKASVLTEAPSQIREMLESQGILKPWEINTAMDLIENHREIYEALGLLNYNYHDFVHSLVVTKAMMLNLQADQNATARDWKVGFVAALLHDFHIRQKEKKENPKQGTIAYVPETIRQIKRLLNMPNGDALPQEDLFEILLNDTDQGPVLQQLAKNIRTFLSEDFDGMMHEVLALILRTHNAYNVAPAPAEYLKKGKAIRATIETEINKKDVKTIDIEEYVGLEYKKLLAEVKAQDEMSANEKNIAETWLEQQQIVELGYLKQLNEVEESRREELNRWANILEKVADKGGNYLVDSSKMIENEIIPGLIGEIPITLKGNYTGFIKNELLNEEVLQFISRLPVETKRLFLHNVGHFAAIDGESDDWNTKLSLQVEKTLFPNGDAAQMATPMIEEVLAQQLNDPSIDQGRAVGKVLGLPENLIPPGIKFRKTRWIKLFGTREGIGELAKDVSHRLRDGSIPNEINVYYGDNMEVTNLIHEFGHYMNLFLNNEALVDFVEIAIEQILKAEPGTLPDAYTNETYERAFQYLYSIRTDPGRIFQDEADIELRQEALNMIGDEWARGLGYYLGKLLRLDLNQVAIERYKVYQDYYRGLGIVRPLGWELGTIVNPEIERSMQNRKKTEKRANPLKTAPDAAATAEAPGGIDLNPDKIQFDRQGQSVDFNLPSNDALIQEYLNIEGFEPIIINITPITNIPLLLGTVNPMPVDQALTKI